MRTMIRVLLADDHPLILRGVRELLAGEADVDVVGAETDPVEVPAAVGRLKPDVLIQDLSMAGQLSGLQVIRAVRATQPATKIVVLSAVATPATIREAMELGAAAFVSKLEDLQQLVTAVRSAHQGNRYCGSLGMAAEVETPWRDSNRDQSAARRNLTRRELEVLRMVAHGHTSGEIAEVLQIGRRTVESHRASVSSKLGVRNPVELVRYAIERGLLSPA